MFIASERILELENQLKSLSRVNSMRNIAIEPPLRTATKNRPANRDWPQNAQIAFKSFSMKLTPDDNYNLSDLNFKIDAGEKFGILSLNDERREAASESGEANMLIAALLRLAMFDDGLIEIDDINIENIGLHDLRRVFTVISSNNALLSGTVRYNLDPFNETTDDHIWEALDHVNLKHLISLFPDKLDTCINSKYLRAVERRQLEIARTLLSTKSKVLIVVEENSNHILDNEQIR